MSNDQITKPESTPAKKGLPMTSIAIAFLVLIVFLGIIGWGLKRTQQKPIAIGDKVPAFTLHTFDQQQINSGDLLGKVVVLNFWASWCAPCESEARELQQAWEHYQPGGEVVFLGADYVDTEPEALAYLKKFDITYPNGPDLRTVLSQMFRIKGVPETYVLDKEGRLAYTKIGPFMGLDEILDAVDGVLKQ